MPTLPGQDKTVLYCPCRRCELNQRQVKHAVFIVNIFETEQLQIENWVETRQNSVYTAFLDRTKLQKLNMCSFEIVCLRQS